MPNPDTRLNVAVWLGTNAHELGHVLFSPRRGSLLMRRVLQAEDSLMKGICRLHNIVEDQRQERLILARFAPWTAYLTAALGHHLKAESDTAWLLMAGRTWLPDSVRAEARSRFVASLGEFLADEVALEIGVYQGLADPGEYEADEAWEVLDRLYELLPQIPERGTGCGGVIIVGSEPDVSGDGLGSPTIPASADEAGVPGASDGSSGDGAGNDPSTNGSGAGKAPGDRSGNAPKIDDDLTKELRNALAKEARKQIERDPATSDDLDSVLDALNSPHNRAGDLGGKTPDGTYMPATNRARRLHHEVGDSLLDLKDESEPGWLKRVESGRLNVRRLLLSPQLDPEQLFDRYEPGQMDASELEVVLLVDVSGSMNAWVMELAEATWAVRHAVDDLDGRITVLAYDSGPHMVVANPGVRPDDRMYVVPATGGTVPDSALREAWQVLGESQARNRILLILTDGDWYQVQADRLIEAMNGRGIITILAFLGAPGRQFDQHGCQHAACIVNPIELARLFNRIAQKEVRKWL